MAHVYTITPNPALDLGGTVDGLIPNEKSYVDTETRYPGGNAINVARVLSRLKIPVIATGFLGGSTGQEIRSLLDVEKVRNRFIQIQGHSRISITISNRADRQQTRLSFPGPVIRSAEKALLFKDFERATGISLLIIGGSLPRGFTPKDVLRLIRAAGRRGIPTIVDCPGNILRAVMAGGPWLIKPNLEEFQLFARRRLRSVDAVEREAKKFLTLVPNICVSSVEEGTLLVTRTGSYFGRIPKVTIRSTVGAGDSMVGAMAAQFYRQNIQPSELLRWGLAAAAATLARSGTAMGGETEIRRLYAKTTVEKLR